MAAHAVTGTRSGSPAATGAVLGGILGFLAGGGIGLLAGVPVGAIEGVLIVFVVTRFAKPAFEIVMSALKAVITTLLVGLGAWWFLMTCIREWAAQQ